VDYDAWFGRQVDEGLAAADRGELIDHEEIVKLIHAGIRANATPMGGSSGA